jgi:hypothetical protein
MIDFLTRRWVIGAGFVATMLLALWPLLSADWTAAMTLIYLAAPATMLHQIEEHKSDRFRLYVNETYFDGREALTPSNVVWINVGWFWGVNLLALYLARFAGFGWGLVAPYMLLVNVVGHIAMAARGRSRNPGLVTAVLLFLPLGLWTVWSVPATMLEEAVGLLAALGVHAAVLFVMRQNLLAPSPLPAVARVA